MLSIHLDQYEQIREHAEQAYPLECCGVLLGPNDHPHAGSGELWKAAREVSMVVPCANMKGQAARTRYKIDPKRLIEIQRGARENALVVVGFYHSHPDAPPYWSRTDLEQAYWTGSSYVIASVMKGAAAEVRSFLLRGTGDEDKKFEEEELLVTETA